MVGVTNCSTRGLKINGAGEGSHRTTKCEGVPLFCAPLFHLADLFHQRDQARGPIAKAKRGKRLRYGISCGFELS
jgi:hypothetical protein